MRNSDRPVLIAALSGRALAAAARRAGERVIVLDGFGDEDTARAAVTSKRIPRSRHGLARAPLLAAIRARRGDVQGLVYGAGFERDPGVLAEIAEIMPILGNPPEIVAAVKDPFRFAALLARLGVPHPLIRREVPAGGDWLCKAVGGSGGTHVTRAERGRVRAGFYAQQAVAGRDVSASFVADGRTAQILAFTEQWASPDGAAPFRYGGCAGPAQLAPALADRIAAACRAIAGAARLIGLNSLDMRLDGDDFHVLEVNPRPGASLDVLDGRSGGGLWRLHRDALAGRLPQRRIGARQVRAAEIVYAPRRVVVPRGFIWPRWSADRGRPGTVIRRGEPICTLHAAAATVALARRRLNARAQQLLDRIGVPRPPRPVIGVQHGEEAALA